MHVKKISNPALAAALLALATGSARGDTVRLASSVKLPVDATAVRLSDVAQLEGSEALRYADLVIVDLTTTNPPPTLTVQDVRSALDDAGAHWGRLNLKGNRTRLHQARRSAAAPMAMRGAAIATRRPTTAARGPIEDDYVARSIIEADTMRGAVARAMTRDLGVSPDDLRLVFAAVDRERLDQPTAGRSFEIKPLDRWTSDRVAISIRSWTKQRIADDGQITLRPLRQVQVAILRHDVTRDTMIEASDLEIVTRWLTFHRASLACRPDDIAGCAATATIRAGEILRRRAVRPPILIERGDRVNVRYLHGGLVISLIAEARDDGAEGDVITLRKLGERSTQTFLATVVAHGQAVVHNTRTRVISTQPNNNTPPGASHDG